MDDEFIYYFIKHPHEELECDEQGNFLNQPDLLMSESELLGLDPKDASWDARRGLHIILACASRTRKEELDPQEKLNLFVDCMKVGIYPPVSLLKYMSDIFENFLNSRLKPDYARLSLDELFSVDKLGPFIKKYLRIETGK